MRKILFILSFFIFYQNLSAQVKGVIIDSAAKTPLDKAVVGLVIKSNITDTLYIITNEKGEFSFDKVPASNFSIVITNVGYRPAAKFVPVTSQEKKIDLGNITLANRAKVLDEVVIESAPITIKEDTIEYRADAFKVKDNAVVEDLLKRLPGVQVDKDGNIKAQGKDVKRVKVNGKDFFGGDPKTATQELPANIVDKIQIIDDYGDQATVSGIKDGDAEKVINIQLKKNKNTGYFGTATAGVGDEGRYQASFNGNYFNNDQQISVFGNSNNISQALLNGGNVNGANNIIALKNNLQNAGSVPNNISNSGGSDGITTTNSVGVNYRDQWSKDVTVYGSYTYSHQNNSGYKTISQQNIFQNKIFINDQNDQFVNRSENHRFYFNLEYIIDSFNYLKISPNISYTTGDGTNNNLFDYFTDSVGKASDGFNDNISNSESPVISGTILFNHRFRKRGRNFSVNFNAGRSENTSNGETENSTTQYIAPIGNLSSSVSNFQLNRSHNYGIRFTYSEPLSKARSLDLAYSHNFSFANNNKITYDIDPVTGNHTIDSLLSNNYENNYFTDRANVSIRTTQKKYNYTLGLSVQPVDLNGLSVTKDSGYRPIKRVNIFPIARLAFNFSKTRSLTISYRGDAQQPSFSQLQDVLDVSNPQYLMHGNPNLKPAINHSINFAYNSFNFMNGQVIFTNISVGTIQNQIVNNVVLLGTSGTQLSTPENVNGFYNASGFYTFSMPFNNRRYIVSLNGNLNYNHNINLIDSLKSIGKNWIVGQGINFDFNFKEWLELGLSSVYTVNSVTYTNTGAGSGLQDQQYGSLVISSNANIDLTKNCVLKYDFDYTVNNGLTGGIGKNPAVLNASLEKQLFKKKNGIIKLQAFDIFNQNSNISRTIASNSIIDSRSNRLTRYFMLSFTYKLQKFKGKQSQPKNLLDLK